MKINRREFLKWSVAAAVALNLDLDMDRVNTVLAAETDPPVIWLNGAGCTGCTISTLNVTNPATIDNVLTSKISLKYNTTLMTIAGESALQALEQAATTYKGKFILVVEGAVPTGSNGNYCIIGEQNGTPFTMQQAVLKYAPMAKYVVSIGTCASFGGVAAAGTSTSSVPVKTLVSGKTTNPVINLPGCPVNPTVYIQTLLDLILTGSPTLDTNGRPTKYYSKTIHSTCPRRGAGDNNAQLGVVACYEKLGCKGKRTMAPCASIKWNNGRSFCILTNHPCIGCSDPSFPTNPLVGGNGGKTSSSTNTSSSSGSIKKKD